jgi:hypothetical protein
VRAGPGTGDSAGGERAREAPAILSRGEPVLNGRKRRRSVPHDSRERCEAHSGGDATLAASHIRGSIPTCFSDRSTPPCNHAGSKVYCLRAACPSARSFWLATSRMATHPERREPIAVARDWASPLRLKHRVRTHSPPPAARCQRLGFSLEIETTPKSLPVSSHYGCQRLGFSLEIETCIFRVIQEFALFVARDWASPLRLKLPFVKT